ncbi:MAG TPA: DNA translocase FtsK 4TM domain-containing protein, partial [Bacteroidota bacterium]|nr:DNA translocase FtsK 4TM domain-containing protein [Bacteroidota bacterium]
MKNNSTSGLSNRMQDRKGNERKIQILAIVLMVAGLFITLSLISHKQYDEAILDRLSLLDIGRVPFDDNIRSIIGNVQNPLGIIGALIANFFILNTVGYASITFPLLLIMWGWILLLKKEYRAPITLTNYVIVFALLFSSALGIANVILGGVEKEWSGIVGAYLADVMIQLLGTVGSSIVVLAAIFVSIVLAIDLDLRKSIERLKILGNNISQWISQRTMPDRSQMEGTDQEVTIVNRDEVVEEDSVESENEMQKFDARKQEEESQVDSLDIVQNSFSEVPQQILEKKNDEIAITEPQVSGNVEPEEIDYIFPSVELLDPPRQVDNIDEEELKANAELVREKLAHFGVEIESVSVTPGPVITLYELVPASGVKISRIVSLADDLALALAAKGIRIIAPIPGKSAVGVEIPNKNPSLVHLRSVINSTKFRELKSPLPLAIGKTISGEIHTDDLTKMPHLLIAGSTGSGKSVGINTILASLLFRLHPSDVKFIIIDPKKIELAQYSKLKNHFLAVSPDIDEEIITTPANAVSALKSVELEMEKRYDRLAATGVRNIQDYNDRVKTGRLKNTETITHLKMPYLIVVIDELADLMITAAREVEEPIARLAQLARAVGIHLVLATQRPSVDVITGVIKANFSARIAYQVASKTDSRTILDMNGAEQLLGNGDMLYLPSGSPKPVRIQNAFMSGDEVDRLTDHISRQKGYNKPFTLPSVLEKKRAGMRSASESFDEFFEEAARLIVRHQQGSVSLLQRRLKVGYSRAARIVDELESAGIVGPFDGSKAREVLIENDEQLNHILEKL